MDPHQIDSAHPGDAAEDLVLPADVRAGLSGKRGLQREVGVLPLGWPHIPHTDRSVVVSAEQVGRVLETSATPLRRQSEQAGLGHKPGHVRTPVQFPDQVVLQA
jgi:hypothetical protein